MMKEARTTVFLDDILNGLYRQNSVKLIYINIYISFSFFFLQILRYRRRYITPLYTHILKRPQNTTV